MDRALRLRYSRFGHCPNSDRPIFDPTIDGNMVLVAGLIR